MMLINPDSATEDAATSPNGGNTNFKEEGQTTSKSEPDTGKTDLARMLWRRSSPARGTIVETYLRGRCCWLDTETVRFLPARGEHPPAMILPFGVPTEPEPGILDISSANIYGVQLTKLMPDGSGKAALIPNKITFGRCVGYPIVWRHRMICSD